MICLVCLMVDRHDFMARTKDISRNDILNAAQRFIEESGCNGFSVRDLAAEVGISSASLHHHFPAKADMLVAVIVRFRETMNRRMGQLDAELDDLPSRVRRLSVETGRMAPHGMTLAAVMAADFNTLPPNVQAEVRLLTTNVYGWLTRFVTQAKNRDELADDSSVDSIVTGMYARLLGEALLARLVSASPSFAGRKPRR